MINFSLSFQLNVSSDRDRNRGMADWVNDEAKRRDEAARREQVFQAKVVYLWERIVRLVQQDAVNIKSTFQIDIKVERKSSYELYIEKDVYPAFYFDVTLDAVGKSIKIHCDRKEWLDQEYQRSDRRLHLGLDENDEPYVAKDSNKLSPEKVSQDILSPILKS